MSFLDANRIELYREDLLKPIQRSWRKLTEDTTKSCIHELCDVFEKWKSKHGKTPPKNRRLLEGTALPPLKDDAPYKCAGYAVKNYTDLAFKLWVDNYTPFKKVCDTYGLVTVLAVTYDFIDEISELNDIESLVRLSCLLYEVETSTYKKMCEHYFDSAMKNSAKYRRSHKALLGLDSGGREKGVIANQLRSEQRKTLWRKIAIDMFRTKPSYSYEQIAFYISKQPSAILNKTGKRYAIRTITDAISGTRKQV